MRRRVDEISCLLLAELGGKARLPGWRGRGLCAPGDETKTDPGAERGPVDRQILHEVDREVRQHAAHGDPVADFGGAREQRLLRNLGERIEVVAAKRLEKAAV